MGKINKEAVSTRQRHNTSARAQIESMLRPPHPWEGNMARYRISALDELVRALGVEGLDPDLLPVAQSMLDEAHDAYNGPVRTPNPLGNLPAKTSRMWEHVYESSQERGLDKGASAAQAWCAVKRQYHKKGNRWLKRKKPLRMDQQPPGCTPVRQTNADACCDACTVGATCESKATNPINTRQLKNKLLR